MVTCSGGPGATVSATGWGTAGASAGTGGIGEGRVYHTATLLPDGKVLLAGGYGSGSLASAELFDPGQDKFFATGDLTTARNGHTATLLANGRVLIAGGWSSAVSPPGSINGAEIYDYDLETLTRTGDLGFARDLHTATTLHDGAVLIVGGKNDAVASLATVEVYEPQWEPFAATAGDLNAGRDRHTATLVTANGTVLVTGGWQESSGGTSLNGVEVFDPATGFFSANTNSLGSARTSHTATLLNDGRVLIAGGWSGSSPWDAEIATLAAGVWSFGFGGHLESARSLHTATILSDGNVLIAGGSAGMNATLDTARVAHPSVPECPATGSLNSKRQSNTATLLPGDEVLIVGGLDEGPNTRYKTLELFTYTGDPSTSSFSLLTPELATARSNHTATLLPNGKVLIAGGWSGAQALASVELYDPVGDTVTGAGQMLGARSDHTATCLADGKVLFTGGHDGTKTLDTAEVYDPVSGTFAPAGTMTWPRERHTATLFPNGQVLLIGGWDGHVNQVLDSAELYR